MSFKVMGLAYEADVGDALAKLVLLVLAEHADNDTHLCWPSLNRIADITHLTRRSVVTKLDYLESKGMITRQRGHKGLSTRYTIIVNQLHTPSVPASPEPIIEPSIIGRKPRLRIAMPIGEDWCASPALRDEINALPNIMEIDHDFEEVEFKGYWLASDAKRVSWDNQYKTFCKRYRTVQATVTSLGNTNRKPSPRNRQENNFFDSVVRHNTSGN